MIKLSNSQMHRGNILTIFSDRNVSSEGQFLLKRSRDIFAVENLGRHLIEISDGSTIDLQAETYKGLIDLIKNENPGHKLNILEVSISSLQDSDVEIEYSKDSIWEHLPSSLKKDLIDCGFSTEVTSIDNLFPKFCTNFDPNKMCYLSLTYSEKALHEKSKQLSPKLSQSFDPARYVDSQISMFMAASALVGMSESE